jgi:hypothetical protein
MIEEALLKSNYIGKDGFTWWIGQVAQKNSWKDKSQFAKEKGSEGEVWPARCKVRVVGYHPFDGNILADEDLPWAQIMLDPSFGSSQGGVGGTINLKGGETCFGFFLDGDDAQQPVVIGLLYRSDGVNNLVSEELIAKEKSSAFKPFTGHPGNLIPATQRSSRADKPIDPENPSAQTPPLSQTDLVNLAFNPNIGFTTSTLNSNEVKFPQYGDRIIFDSASLWQVAKKSDSTLIIPNGCQNNLIGQITQALQDFMAITNGLDKYLNTYIDPVLNEIANVGQIVRNAARSITGVVKLIINNLRNTIFKCISWAFRKLVGKLPPPLQTISLEAMKKILDKIFCILDKLPASIFDFIQGLLEDLVDSTINAPLCAVEQWTAGILSNLMNGIEDALSSIMSGLDWLTGGLGTVSSILNQANSLASQIFSFLDCTGLACKTPTVWASKFGPNEKESDDWEKAVQNVNVFKGLAEVGTAIDDSIRQSALYTPFNLGGLGSISNLFQDNSCSSKVTNPQTQDDLMPMPIGSKWKDCIPPAVRIIGDGVGAKAIPIVGDNKKIFAIQITNGGVGYTQGNTTVRVVDNSGYGSGATAAPIIGAGGSITAIYLTTTGDGYCGGSLIGIGSTAGPGIGSTAGPGIGSTGVVNTATPGISSYVSGCVESLVVISPGYGYTTGDRITDGKNTYTPNVSPSGSIVSVQPLTNTVCGFTDTPTIIINTKTGVAAEIIPVMKFTPTYISGMGTASMIGIAVTSVIDCI